MVTWLGSVAGVEEDLEAAETLEGEEEAAAWTEEATEAAEGDSRADRGHAGWLTLGQTLRPSTWRKSNNNSNIIHNSFPCPKPHHHPYY